MKTVRAALILVFTWVAMGTAHSQPAKAFPGADWQGTSPEAQGLASAKLQAAVTFMDESFGADGARELVIIRNGRLIWRGPQADAYHKLCSVTKVFTSTVPGLMIGDGKCTLDTLAVEHLPDLDDQYPAYAQIRLQHLASMTGGYHGRMAGT